MTVYDIAIIGGGPAGLTAAIYARRGGKSVLLLEKEGFGGQMARSPRVENYPGFCQISGAALADQMLEQALALGTETELAQVTALAPRQDLWQLETDAGLFSARAVVVAAGVRHRRLGLPEEERFLGDGVSFCAVCDGAFYENKTAAVIGGGDSAFQEALLLSGLCREVILCHRRGFTAEQALQQALLSRPNVTALNGVRAEGFLTDEQGALSGLRMAYVESGERFDLACDGVFEAVGLEPDNAPFAQLGLDQAGYILAGEDGKTAAPGVFAAGDCRTKTLRQIAGAVGDGAAAAMAACRYLDRSR